LRPLKVGGPRIPIIAVGETLETEDSPMNGIILFVTPTIVALGALASLWLARRVTDETETQRARVRLPVRRR